MAVATTLTAFLTMFKLLFRKILKHFEEKEREREKEEEEKKREIGNVNKTKTRRNISLLYTLALD
jgi:hypothetical protein